jgi:hypothetical protein
MRLTVGTSGCDPAQALARKVLGLCGSEFGHIPTNAPDAVSTPCNWEMFGVEERPVRGQMDVS